MVDPDPDSEPVFLNDGEDIANNMVKLGRSMKEKSLIEGLLNDINVMLGSYIRSQVILAGMTLVAYTLVLGILRVPYALILGPVAGFLEFIPVVGPAIAAASVLLIAILAGYPHGVWLFVFLGAWRLTQDYVNAPRIMGKALEINPLMQIFAVLTGAEIAGVVGALISVPVVAILRIIGRRIVVREEGTRNRPGPLTTLRFRSTKVFINGIRSSVLLQTHHRTGGPWCGVRGSHHHQLCGG